MWCIWDLEAYYHALPPQVSFAELAGIDGFSCARGIKHLALRTLNPHCGQISSAMSELEQLETLWLCDWGGMSEASGGLQLSGLRSLRSLVLCWIVPESISCSDRCELHVELGIYSMEHAVWDTVLPRVRSVTLLEFSFRPALVALPSILLKAGNLSKADVRVQQCGTASAPLLLGGSLAHVEELVLDCVKLHAIVPAGVTWRTVYVAATEMNLRFEAVAPFGEAIPAFCFRFNKLQVCYAQPSLYLFMAITFSPAPDLLRCSHQGTEMYDLAAAVAKRRPEWTGIVRMGQNDSQISQHKTLTSGMCFPMAQPPCKMWWEDHQWCCCGACFRFLCKAGIAH